MAGILFEELAVAESEATATEDLGKTVRYNDTRDNNKRATYYIIHQLFPVKTMCLMHEDRRYEWRLDDGSG
jgi:hypothetical protein